MFPDLSSVLGEGEDSPNIVVHEGSTDKSCFIVHHFISRAVKNGRKLFILGLEQSFGHYHSVGLKSGLNLLKQKENGRVIFYEGLKKILSLCDSDSSKVMSSHLGGVNSLEAMYKDILRVLDDCEVMVVDNLAITTCLGHSSKAIFAFINKLRQTLASRGCQLIIRLSSLPSDPASVSLSSLTNLRSELSISVEGLATGQSRDVSGCIVLRAGERPKRNYQFLFEERGVRIFAPGTSAAVL